VTLSTFNYSEVGSIAIGGVDPAGSYGATNYLGMSGLHVPILSDVIGRFVPHHFDTEVPSNACGTFSYSGQPFPARITARNISGGTTQNYTNTFAKDVTFSDTNGATGIFSPAPLPASAFSAGVADKSIPPYSVNFTFTDKLTIPATIKLHAADTDNVTSTTGAEGTTPIRSGRLVLQNAYGPETADHILPFQNQYFANPGQWLTNTEDGCTTLAGNNFGFSNYLPQLTADEMGSGHIDAIRSTLTTGNGRGSLFLTMPTNGDGKYVGSVDVCVDLGPDTASVGSPPNTAPVCVATSANMPWLQGRWSETNYDDDPTGRVNFGIYRGNDRIINWREIIR
jgi:MSHA biogenesis protein MshQ